MGDNNVNLPPGFRFYPTDEELVVHFLHRKALAEGNKWYFYSRKTQNRATSNGYWKAMGMEDPVNNSAGKKVGMKKYLVFHVGEAPSGIKTNWTMQEYRLSDSAASTSTSTRSSKRRGHSKIDYSNWVICRVYERDDQDHDDGTELSCLDEVFLSLDDLDEISLPN
ncbi:hypothetical protein F2P56_029070 [Juglans regia]|uniref:NAC domain-containing protein 104 isoform X2 n=2 Tax=Juglans regia TaxID=51240 RepID=A0A2I4GDP9_JUGRE|nr:NAC domain-containing protein 104 isoform X2 [Juglans regia]KAF5448550.1 hypothetical protein F2P56_029070 [Juglans regia]